MSDIWKWFFSFKYLNLSMTLISINNEFNWFILYAINTKCNTFCKIPTVIVILVIVNSFSGSQITYWLILLIHFLTTTIWLFQSCLPTNNASCVSASTLTSGSRQPHSSRTPARCSTRGDPTPPEKCLPKRRATFTNELFPWDSRTACSSTLHMLIWRRLDELLELNEPIYEGLNNLMVLLVYAFLK